MTENEMMKMQQEAVRRAREMQNRARTDNIPQRPVRNMPKRAAEKETPPEPFGSSAGPPEHFPKESDHEKQGSNGVLDILFKDSEKTLILCLLLLLIEEKSDNSLVMALLYLIL